MEDGRTDIRRAAQDNCARRYVYDGVITELCICFTPLYICLVSEINACSYITNVYHATLSSSLFYTGENIKIMKNT